PDGTNVSFGHGTHATWGAVGHWGAPDIGWEGRDVYNEWTYIVYTYDSETFTTRVYTDGVLSNFEELPAPLDTFAEDSNVNPLPFRVARQSNADGTVSDVGVGQINIARIRVHDSVLPEEEVLANYDLEKETFGKGDTDNDGMLDSYEDRFTFLDRNNPDDAALDEDKDGLTNLKESELDTNPGVADSDGDGVSDGDEVNGSPVTNPLVADTDGDGLSDGAEKEAGTNPTLVDSDGDTYPDGQEVLRESDPTSASSVPEFNAPLVDLNSAELATGSLQSWENTGLLGGSFAGSSPAPEVVEINGVKGVQFNGSNQFMTGPSTPGFITGAAPRTIEAWVYNPAAADEETIFSWGTPRWAGWLECLLQPWFECGFWCDWTLGRS
ncbi:MAG: MSCRAMM family adhesin SdrC, partial [Verrucomicrobia bacterium]|nr:MSCRAMM family adhesin SdrC [Verrucomicrobiota bacterium]